MRHRIVFAALSLAGCAGQPSMEAAAAAPATETLDWRQVATPADRTRLRGWRTAFVTGLDQARKGGHAADLAKEGRLLEPDAGVMAGRPPSGDYRCRVIKLGSPRGAGLPYVSYSSFGCRIEDEGTVASFTKLTGSQRPVGVILGSPRRLVFLGTLMLGDEKRALDYGRDPDRDMIGAIESIGDGRWRMILPYPHYESLMDVIELVPVAGASNS